MKIIATLATPPAVNGAAQPTSLSVEHHDDAGHTTATLSVPDVAAEAQQAQSLAAVASGILGALPK